MAAVCCAVSGVFLIATHGNWHSLNVSREGIVLGLMTSVEPVTATLLAALFLGTAFERVDIAGFLLVLATGFVLDLGKRSG